MWVAASFGLRDLVMTLKVYHFHHAFFQFLQLAFEGNPTAVLGEDAGVTVTRLSPQLAPLCGRRLSCPGLATRTCSSTTWSQISVVQRWRRHVQLAWPVRC